MNDVIAAIATAKAPSAIGIIRLSGEGCAQVAQQVFTLKSGRPLAEAPQRKLLLGTVHDRQGRVIDQAMVVRCAAPHSYTGEDTVELHCHGSPALLVSALEALFAAGARQAKAGEFTKRAFLNGQLDLSQAEAVIDLIDAESADAAANAAGQLAGALTQKIEPIYNALTDLCSHFHAVLDYPDEDIEDFGLQELTRTIQAAKTQIAKLIAGYEQGRHIKHGVKTVLLGRPNAGKSSVFNALAGYDRVIVTQIAGTTRDTVEEPVRLGKVLLRLTDTAGIRDTSDCIEALGVERSEKAAQEAELAIFVCDSAQALTDEDVRAMEIAKKAPKCLALLNKSDCEQLVTELPFETVLSVSAKTGQNIDKLKQLLESWYADGVRCDGSLLTNARQFGALKRADEALDRAHRALSHGITPDAILTDVEEAMAAMGEVTGHTVREDITNRIFERFCVGK